MYLLGCLPLLLIVLLILLFSVVRGLFLWLLCALFPWLYKGKQRKAQHFYQTQQNTRQESAPKKKNIIERDEGEYVEFEEIKDTDSPTENQK